MFRKDILEIEAELDKIETEKSNLEKNIESFDNFLKFLIEWAVVAIGVMLSFGSAYLFVTNPKYQEDDWFFYSLIALGIMLIARFAPRHNK